jgi:hypothetical protein
MIKIHVETSPTSELGSELKDIWEKTNCGVELEIDIDPKVLDQIWNRINNNIYESVWAETFNTVFINLREEFGNSRT